MGMIEERLREIDRSMREARARMADAQQWLRDLEQEKEFILAQVERAELLARQRRGDE
jgi:hypothetical protein